MDHAGLHPAPRHLLRDPVRRPAGVAHHLDREPSSTALIAGDTMHTSVVTPAIPRRTGMQDPASKW